VHSALFDINLTASSVWDKLVELVSDWENVQNANVQLK